MLKKKFRWFPPERMYEDFPWQIWAVGWLSIFKGTIWLVYEPNIAESVLKILGYKYLILMIPLVVLGVGVWNLKKWALWGIIGMSIVNLIFIFSVTNVFDSLFIKSEVYAFSILLSIIVLIGNGPLGDIFIIVASPFIFKHINSLR